MKPTNLFILNRAGKLPEDGWSHAVPIGEFPVVDDGGAELVQVVDAKAVQSMADAFAAEGVDVLVDFDHFSLDAEKSTEAAGWIKNVAVRDSGLWAKVEWTDIGEPAVLNKRFRFVSPVFPRENLENLGGNRVRPLRLRCLAITNQPNMRGMVPLSNRGTSHPTQETRMKRVVELLGLPADATEDSAVAAVTALQNSAKEIAVLKNRAESAEAKIATIEAQQLDAAADAFCDKNSGVIENRAEVKAQFIANRASTEKLFSAFKAQPAKADTGTPPISNRQKQPTDQKPGADQKAAAIRNRAHQIAKEQSCSFATAFERAREEAKD